MPVYRQHIPHLRKALRSMRNQKERFYFVIVLDGSPDEVEQVVRSEAKRIPRCKIIKLPSNQGVATALNQGFHFLMKKSQIRYLSWVSSDNIYYPKYLKLLRHALHHAPKDVGLVHSNYLNIDDDGKRLDSPVALNQRAQYLKDQDYLIEGCNIGVSFLYKKEYARKVGDYQYDQAEDYDFWLRLTEICKWKWVPKVLMSYRVNSRHSISSSIHETIAKHRYWRNILQQIKADAYRRRGIKTEMTVLWIVDQGNEEIINSIENLLSQNYSNYQFNLIDHSESGTIGSSIMNLLQDPRMRVLKQPKSNLSDILRKNYTHRNTKYLLFVNQKLRTPFWNTMELGDILRGNLRSSHIIGLDLANKSPLYSLPTQIPIGGFLFK